MFWMLKLLLCLSVATITFYSSTMAVPIPALDLSSLTKRSSLIAVGKVFSVRDNGTEVLSIQGQSFSAKRKLAELQVSRVLKGQSASSIITFEFVTTTIYLGFGDIFVNQTGMFFLSPKSSQGLTVTDNYHPYVVAAMTSPGSAGSDYERVIAEVANVLVLPQTTSDEKIKAISVLDPIKTTDTTKSLRLAADSGEMNVKLRAIAALLRRNDITKLETAERALLQAQPGTDSYSMASLTVAIEYVKDPGALPILTRLLGAHYVRARHSAAAAIRHIGTDAAIEPLTQALYDNDHEVRYQAVIGLAEITGQGTWGPTTDKYGKEEQRYLEYWRKWAKER